MRGGSSHIAHGHIVRTPNGGPVWLHLLMQTNSSNNGHAAVTLPKDALERRRGSTWAYNFWYTPCTGPTVTARVELRWFSMGKHHEKVRISVMVENHGAMEFTCPASQLGSAGFMELLNDDTLYRAMRVRRLKAMADRIARREEVSSVAPWTDMDTCVAQAWDADGPHAMRRHVPRVRDSTVVPGPARRDMVACDQEPGASGEVVSIKDRKDGSRVVRWRVTGKTEFKVDGGAGAGVTIDFSGGRRAREARG